MLPREPEDLSLLEGGLVELLMLFTHFLTVTSHFGNFIEISLDRMFWCIIPEQVLQMAESCPDEALI